VKVLDTATGRILSTLDGHKKSVDSASFSANGKTIVTAGSDRTIRVWDSATGRCISVLSLPRTSGGRWVLVSDADRIIASGGTEVDIFTTASSELAPPPWFSKFLRYATRMRIGSDGAAEVIPAADWSALRNQVLEISRRTETRDTFYGWIVRRYIEEE